MTDFFGTSLFAASAAIFGPLAGWLAARRGRSPITWLVFGALLGPVAALLLAIAPPGRCAFCDSKIRGWPATCQVCGLPFGTPLGTPASPIVAVVGPDVSEQDWAPAPAVSPPMDRPAPTGRRTPRLPRSASRGESAAGAAAVTSEILASGVYFGGTTSLVPGARYALALHGPSLRLLGPLDEDPTRVAFEHRLDQLVATAIEDRLLMTVTSPGGAAIGLGAFAGRRAFEVESALMAGGGIPGPRAVAR